MKKSNWHGGKGSGRRSTQDDNKYADNWEKIFGKTEGCPVKAYIEDVKKHKTEANVDYPQRTNVNTRNNDTIK